MENVVPLEDAEEITTKQKAFCHQFAANLNSALDEFSAIPSGYGRVTAVAKLFNVSTATASGWIKGDGVPELWRLSEMASIMGTTLEQLVNGCSDAKARKRYAAVDVHGYDIAGRDSWYTLPEALRYMGLRNAIRVFQVNSDDMAPYLQKGDLAVYDPGVNHIHSNGVFVLKIDGQFIVRRIQRGNVRRNIRLICDNAAFVEEICEESEFDSIEKPRRIEVVGYVVGRLLLDSVSRVANYASEV